MDNIEIQTTVKSRAMQANDLEVVSENIYCVLLQKLKAYVVGNENEDPLAEIDSLRTIDGVMWE